jgi:hypothetical protein
MPRYEISDRGVRYRTGVCGIGQEYAIQHYEVSEKEKRRTSTLPLTMMIMLSAGSCARVDEKRYKPTSYIGLPFKAERWAVKCLDKRQMEGK